MATLPSSPPLPMTRSRSRSRSRSPSNYSLDLDALMPPEDESEIMTPLRPNHIDVVHSEDIDGPTDFTQNLEYWMTTKLPNVTRPSYMTGPARDDLEEYISEGAETGSPKRVEEAKDSLMDTEAPRKEGEDMSFLSNIPSSLHANEAQKSTPRTVEHAPMATQKEFQASVEDHDDTPSRVRESSSAIGATLRSPELTVKSRSAYLHRESKQDNEETETVKSLREALSKLRGELNDVCVKSQQELGRVRAEYEKRAEDRRTTQELQMQAQEREWQRRLSSARVDHEQRLNAALSAANSDDKRRVQQELQKMATQLAAKDSKISELEAMLSTHNQDLQAAETKNATMQQERDAAIENHQATMIAQRDAQRLMTIEARDWEAQCDKLRNSKLGVEEKLESLQAEIANMTLEHANEIDRLTSRIEDAANATQRAVLQEQKASQSTIDELEQENNRLHNQLDNKDDEIDALGDDLQQLRVRNSGVVEEKDKLAAKLREQRTLNEQAAREIQSLRSGTKILQSRLGDAEKTDTTALETLESQLAEANAARLEADAEVDDLKAELNAVKASLSTSQTEVLAAQEELARFKDGCELVNTAMDKRMRELMRAREIEWAKRLEGLRREMGFRGEVLMREWGRVEVGASEPQGYRYKFV